MVTVRSRLRDGLRLLRRESPGPSRGRFLLFLSGLCGLVDLFDVLGDGDLLWFRCFWRRDGLRLLQRELPGPSRGWLLWALRGLFGLRYFCDVVFGGDRLRFRGFGDLDLAFRVAVRGLSAYLWPFLGRGSGVGRRRSRLGLRRFPERLLDRRRCSFRCFGMGKL